MSYSSRARAISSLSDWSADGRFIAYTDRSSATTADIWVLPLFGDRKPFPVAQTAFNETLAAFSPDGRWVAYVTNEANQGNVYVSRFQRPTGSIRYHGTEGPVRSGEETARSCFTSVRTEP